MRQKMSCIIGFISTLIGLALVSAEGRGQDYEPPDPVYPLPTFITHPTSGAFTIGGVFVEFHDSKQGKKSRKPLDLLIKEYESVDPAVNRPAGGEFPEGLKELINRCQDASRPLTKEDENAISAFLGLIRRKKDCKIVLDAIEEMRKHPIEAVRFFITALGVKDADVQTVAMRVLASFDEPSEAMAKIQSFLKEKDKNLRFTAVMVLVDMGLLIDDQMEAVLLEALKVDWKGIQPDAFERLIQIGKMDFRLALIALKSHNKEMISVGMAAISVLGMNGELVPEAKEAVPILIEKLKDPGLSQDAARTLSNMGRAAEPAVPIMVKALTGSDVGLAWEIPYSLGRLGPAAKAAVPALIEEVKNGSQSAAAALGQIGRDAQPAVPALQAAAKNGSVSAAGALWDITHQKEEVLPVLLRALKGGWASAGDISQIIFRMGPDGKEMVPHLIAYLKQNENEEASFYLGLSEEPIIALGQIGPAAREAIPLLKQTMKKCNQAEYADRKFQLTIAYSLWQIDHQENQVFTLLKGALKTNCAESAIEVIGKMGPPAKEFVPDLLALAKEAADYPMMAKVIIHALEKVDPEAATKLKMQRRLNRGPSRPKPGIP